MNDRRTTEMTDRETIDVIVPERGTDHQAAAKRETIEEDTGTEVEREKGKTLNHGTEEETEIEETEIGTADQ